MEGAGGPSSSVAELVDVDGQRQKRRRRRLGAALGLVAVVLVAAAGATAWAGLRHRGGTSNKSPFAGASEDAGKSFGPLPSPGPLWPSVVNGDGGAATQAVGTGTFSGASLPKAEAMVSGGSSPSGAPSGSSASTNAMGSLLAPANSIAATPGAAATTTAASAVPPALGTASETPPANAPAFQALQGRLSSGVLGLRTCYPKTGAEVVAMTKPESPCTVLILTKSSTDFYSIKQTMNISTTKIIIGHPIDPPILNATRIERLFDVRRGGYLDLRAVQLIKGVGRRFDNGSLVLITGASVRVWPGGLFRGTEVFFRELPQTLAAVRNDLSTPNLRRRIFGGHVLVMGGVFRCVGCMTYRRVPFGVLTANMIQIGRDILVVSGLATYVGGYAGNALLFLASINVGNNLCVLGGVGIWVGGGGQAAAAAIGQFGAGQNLWVGGGVLIMVGYQDVSCFLSIQRAGFGQYSVGGGVFIMVGELENRAWGVGSVFNAGQAYSCGGGIMQMQGGEGCNTQISTIQAVAGGSMFLGSGDMIMVGFPFVRFAVTQAQYGCGMVWFNGAGTGTYVYTPATTISVVRAQILRGIELCMGYGFNTNVLNVRRAFQVVNALIGGNEFFIGGGAAVFIRVRSIIRRKINFRTSRVAFYVAGTEVIGEVSRKNIYVDKEGIFLLSHQHNATHAVRPPRARSTHGHSRHRALGGLPYLSAEGANRSSLVLAQADLDTVSGVSLDLEAFKAQWQRLLDRNGRAAKSNGGGQRQGRRRLMGGIGPLGEVSVTDLAKVWREAFDASTSSTSSSDAVRAKPQRTQEIEGVYVGGKDNQCLLCGVAPLPSALHLPPPPGSASSGEGVAECLATDACVAEGVPQTAAGALAAAVEAAAPEELVLPAHVKYALPLAHRKLLAPSLSPSSRNTQAATKEAVEKDEDDAPPELSTISLLAYDLLLYCNPAQSTEQEADAPAASAAAENDDGNPWTASASSTSDGGCELSNANIKAALKALARGTMEAQGLDFPFQLTVATQTLALPVAAPALEAEVAETLAAVPDVGLDGCSTAGAKFAVYATTSENAGFDALQSLFEGWRRSKQQQQEQQQGQGQPDLLAALAEAGDVDAGTLCSLQLRPRMALRLPPIDSAEGVSYYQRLYMGGSGSLFSLPGLSESEPQQRRQQGGASGTYGLLDFPNAILADEDEDEDEDRDIARRGKGQRARNLLSFPPASLPFAFPALLLLQPGSVAPVQVQGEPVVAGHNYTLALSHFDLGIAGVEVRLYEGVPPTARQDALLATPSRRAAPGNSAVEDAGDVLALTFTAPEPVGGPGGRSRAFLRASYAGLPVPFCDSLAFDLVGSGG